MTGAAVALVVVFLVTDEFWPLSDPSPEGVPLRLSPHDPERVPPLDLTTLRTGVQLRLEDAAAGTAGESCASNDGPAVQLTFHYPQNPAETQRGDGSARADDASAARQPLISTPETAKAVAIRERWRVEELERRLVAREFNIRVNAHTNVVKALGTWDTIGGDSRYGLPPSFSAWVSLNVNGGADHAIAGKVVISKADVDGLEGEIDLVLESGRWVKERFKVKIMPRNPLSICG